MNYYISDLHFGHKNALKFDNRPYFTLTEMKDDIIKRWNERVKKNDNVYIWTTLQELLMKLCLRGRKKEF